MTSLTGMDRSTGKVLSGDAHLAQSIGDIISTPLGTRPMRRDYGCLLPELLDRPLTRATRLLASVAIAMAVARWEPRVIVRKVELGGELVLGQLKVTIIAARADQAANALTRLTIPLSPST
ncbi:GPW/gp25 family protein [Novosphingobium sp.]|uniref:GPW/gp25 family protein n=1 Tax=Novosphingobium sp. TaxID=1874826 RepID=UPI002604C3B5|nr:GPW/gp25 family protein [Novosphingobium sp.]